MSSNIKRFNELWEKKEITKPLVFLYGGYAGTGKSTVCKRIMELINYTTNLPTGVIRSSIKDYLTNQDIELVSSHTYTLHKVGTYVDPRDKCSHAEIIDRFLRQIAPIAKAINSVVSFAASEKQHIIIDGNHVFPGLILPNDDVHMMEFYNKVTDPKKHYEMLCGPTHSRTLNEEEFATARILHDHTVEQCIANQKSIYEYDEAISKVEKVLEKELGRE